MTETDSYTERFRTAPVPSKWPTPWPTSRSKTPTTALVSLSCGHTNEFDLPAPRPGERIWCRSCRTDRRVTKPATPNNTEEN